MPARGDTPLRPRCGHVTRPAGRVLVTIPASNLIEIEPVD